MTVDTQDVRQLVTVETIADIRPIPDADAIETARVRGWDVVMKKGEVDVGDEVLYFEIDSALPLDDERFAFLEARGSKTLDDGSRVHVLKTARLRGQYSQGLAMPVSLFPEVNPVDDVAAQLGVTKYEPPIPANLAGQMVGPFPTNLVQKTDSERVQNLTEAFAELRETGDWVATEKIDGSSVTYIVTGNPENPLRVCSRNWELVPDQNLTSVTLAERYRLADLPAGTIVQGEVYGEGVQGNPLKIKGSELAVFNVYSGPHQMLARTDWPDSLRALAAPELDFQLPDTVDAAVAQVNGMKSVASPGHQAEGIVWHERSGTAFRELGFRANLKVINNKYLLKHG